MSPIEKRINSIDPNRDRIPNGWEKRTSRTTGQIYYLNMYTKESQWEEPTNKATEPLDPDPVVITVRHLLVKHRDSRKPSSWREDEITRTKEEAMTIIQDYRNMILDGDRSFAQMTADFSDCSSAKFGGDIGRIHRRMMKKPFEDIAFKLSVKELSDVVETDSGYHLILRIA